MSGLFTKKSHIPFSAETVFDWHSRPGAIERLSPPWDPLVVLERSGGIQNGDTVKMRMRQGPVSYDWHARHTDFQSGRLFRDEETKGPFKRWIHTHQFKPIDPTSCWLEDNIEYQFPFDPITEPLMDRFVQSKLSRIFSFRHFTTICDLKRHQEGDHLPKQTVLISGASGLIGTNLSAFLTTGGHKVWKLVRRKPVAHDEIYWNPTKGELDLSVAGNIEAIIHLAGENIGYGRWTANKKKTIVDSRVDGTTLLADKIASGEIRPNVFLSSSAIGYYGDRGLEKITESDPPGHDFISDVCVQWESATQSAQTTGTRVVLMRIGVVIDPRGGALSRLLPMFKMGIGGKIGNGQQYLSWITLDDAIGAIYKCLIDQRLEGPVNIVTPHPVTNTTFTKTLGRVLKKPAVTIIPSGVIKTVFGQQGKEILLSSANVSPTKLENVGFWYSRPELTDAVRTILGREVASK